MEVPSASTEPTEIAVALSLHGKDAAEYDKKSQAAQQIVADSLGKIGEYLKTELTAASDEYKVLETMNSLARDRYADYNSTAQGLISTMASLQQTYTDIDPIIHQIFDLERQVANIEQVVAELDDYTRRLEDVYKKRTK
ncbi:hypothetical protein HDV00_000829 [Rhizophlyctis rosea]|nr:hypothetical protein HDV00_000829 [Rhizophlyctis rosea]